MCGIAGLAMAALSADHAVRVLGDMADRLRHRGPDDAGILWNEPARVGLAHRRLAILDPGAHGRQPMTSACGRFALVLNGEICNAPSLARELVRTGARFLGHSDTEVAVAAVAAWGVARALERFAGMFALAIHDREARTLHLARDRIGVKPLHCTWIGPEGTGMLAFASEPRALLAVPGFRAETDPDALAGFFARCCVPGDRSIWRGVRRVPAGARLELDLTTGVVRCVRFWDAEALARDAAASGCATPESDLIDQAEALLTQVVDEHLVSDGPVGCFLSGGVDSGLVTALASRRRPGMPTFTVASEDASLDESDAALRAARSLGTDHRTITLDGTTALRLVAQLPEVHDEPFADASAIATLHLARTAGRDVRVALAGDGGDELFGGYNRHRMAAVLWPVSRRLPAPARRWIAATLGILRPETLNALLPTAWLGPRPGDRVRKLARVVASDSEASAYEAMTLTWAPPPVRGAAAGPCGWWNAHAAASLPDFLHRAQFMDLRGYLQDDGLVKVDRASMAVGLEVRVPLLDHRLVEFSWRLPTAMRVRRGVGKWLLRRVLDRRAPGVRMADAKSGFAVPLARWLRGPLRSWAHDLLDARRLRQHPMVDHGPMDRAWRRLCAGDDQEADRVWACLMFAAWSARWEASS